MDVLMKTKETAWVFCLSRAHQKFIKSLNVLAILQQEETHRSQNGKKASETECANKRRYETRDELASHMEVSRSHKKVETGDPSKCLGVFEPMAAQVVDDTHPYHSIGLENMTDFSDPSPYELYTSINETPKGSRMGFEDHTETSRFKTPTSLDPLQTTIDEPSPFLFPRACS